MFQPIPKWGKTGQTPPKWSTPTGRSRCLANAQAKQMSVKTCCWVIIIGIHKVLPLVSCSGSKSMVPCFCCLYPREWWQAPHSCWQYDLQQLKFQRRLASKWIKTYPFSSHPQKRCQYRPKYGVTNEIFWVWRLFMTWSIPIYCHRPSRPSAFSSASPSAARAPSPSRSRPRPAPAEPPLKAPKVEQRPKMARAVTQDDLRWGMAMGQPWGRSLSWKMVGFRGISLTHTHMTNKWAHIMHMYILICIYYTIVYSIYIYTYTYSSIELERKISWNVKITSSPITTRSFPWIIAGFCGAHQSALASGRSKLLEGRRGSRSWASRVWPKKKPCPILDELWDDNFMIL